METTDEDDMGETERFVLVPVELWAAAMVEQGMPDELVAPLLPEHARSARGG